MLAAYVAVVLAVYAPLGCGRLSEVLRIPLVSYVELFVLAAIIVRVIGLLRLFCGTPRQANEQTAD